MVDFGKSFGGSIMSTNNNGIDVNSGQSQFNHYGAK